MVCLYQATSMLVIAIEGAEQLAGLNQAIVGFKFTDATFPYAIAVGGAEGIEVQRVMRPLSNTVKKDFDAHEYWVCVRKEDER